MIVASCDTVLSDTFLPFCANLSLLLVAGVWKRKLEAVEVINFLWKQKHLDERGWKRKQTRKQK